MKHNLALLLIILTESVSLLLQPVAGEVWPLIKKVCKWTPFKDVCRKCLYTGPLWEPTDPRTELAPIAVDCTMAQSRVVIDNFDSVANRTSDDAIKNLCFRCQKDVETALTDFDGISNDLNYGKYHRAADLLVAADVNYTRCYKIFPFIGSMQQNFIDDFYLLKKYYMNTEAILYKL